MKNTVLTFLQYLEMHKTPGNDKICGFIINSKEVCILVDEYPSIEQWHKLRYVWRIIFNQDLYILYFKRQKL